MSWHISRALMEAYENSLCSQERVEEYLGANYSDGEPLPPLSGNPTPQAYLSPDRITAFSRLSRYGMTFKPLTDAHSEAVLTWYLAGFPVRTSASQEKAQESTANAPECGSTWRGSLAKFDPVSCTWKTAQLSLIEDLEPCSVTWPRSGMTVDGLCLELPMLGRRTSGTGSGLWPTPVASDTSSRTKPYAQGGTPLSLAVKWPTPTVCGNYNRKGASATSGDGLATAVATSLTMNCWAGTSAQTATATMYPTPTRRDHKGGYTTQALTRKDGKSRKFDALPNAVIGGAGVETVSGVLNPTWVEWLMGWPLGWTDLRPLETDKSLSARQQHGECLQEACE